MKKITKKRSSGLFNGQLRKASMAFGLLVSFQMVSQTSYTFTSAGATGQVGPSQAQVNSAYAATNLSGLVTVLGNGVQQFVVPSSGVYRIRAIGASGGSVNVSCVGLGGLGADISGDYNLTAGQTLLILVGQRGLSNGEDAGGGGGTYVTSSSSVAMVVAGGGGGGSNNINNCGSNLNGVNGSTTTAGTAGAGGLGTGGVNGNGGAQTNGGSGGGGGGFITNGSGGFFGLGFMNGGNGGTGSNNNHGGYGGGGSGWHTGGNGGGGGGYSGGGTSGNQPFTGGGGGGSYNTGINQTNTVAVAAGSGSVIIQTLCGVKVSASNTVICSGTDAVITASSTGIMSYAWNSGQTTDVITVTPPMTTTYVVVGTEAVTNCTSTAQIAITVLPAPPVTIMSLAQSVCLGESVTMQAFSGSSYTWSAGPAFTSVITVTPTLLNNTYTVIASGLNGCTAQAVQQIEVNPLPVPAISGNTIICNGSTANLTASGATSYEWTSSTIYLQSNPVSLSPNTTTTFSVIGTSSVGCKGSTVFVLAVDPCTGIQNMNSTASHVSVYPNPNAGIFTVSLNNGKNKTIDVMDVTGRVVLSTNTTSDLTDVNISTLANGVYYVKVASENASDVIKIVKQ